MTKFIAYYNLCPIHDTKEFLGLSPDCDSGNIIATLGRNIAMVIKISNQKQICSWSALEKFSCKVVYDHKSQQYVGVFANRFVRQWDDTVSNINKCKKLKFQRNIVDLVYDPIETLVVYADGTCESLSSAIHSRKEQTEDLQLEIGSENAIIDPKIVNLDNERKFLYYFQKDKVGNLELVKMELDLSNLKPLGDAIKYPLRRGGQDVTVAGYSVIESENSPALLTIWADGRVFLLNLVDNVDSRNSPGQFVSMFTDLKVDTPLTILGLSKHCIAIYGANSTQEGGSLLLYNTQFKVVKAKQFFKIYFNYSRLWSAGSSILLAMGQNLSVVSYQMSKESLADLVGSQISNDFTHSVEAEFVNEEEELEEHLCLAEIQKPPSGHFENVPRKKDKKLEAIFADGKTVPFKGVDGFEKDLNRLMNRDIHVELLQVESAHEDFEINLMSNYYDSGFVTEEVQIIAKQLEKCGASEHEISEKLLCVLIKADLVEDIAACLRRYTSISERILVKTLKYVLQDFEVPSTEKPLEKYTNKKEHMEVDTDLDKTEAETDGSEFPNVNLLAESNNSVATTVKDRRDLMNIILSCSFDAQTISAYIQKEIDYDEVLKMLEYLYVLITSKEPCLEERPDRQDKNDDDLRILKWFGIFLNTHFQKMSLSKDLRLCEVLSKWHKILADYKREVSELEHVAALLYNIVEKKQISKERNYSKWYSIEEIRLY